MNLVVVGGGDVWYYLKHVIQEKSNINMVIKASAGAGAQPDSHPLSPVPKMPALSGPLFHPWCLTQFLSWDR